jgi:cell shape-determining protein MreC
VLQPLAWVEAAGTGLGRGLRDAYRAWTTDAPHDPTALEQRISELQLQVGAQSVQIAELETQLGEVTAMREVVAETGFRIIPARLMSGTPVPGRESINIGRGSSHGVRVGDWVAAGQAEERRDEKSDDRQRIQQQWLIGQVIATHPYVSTVRLCTDTGFPATRVSAARRLEDGRWRKADKQAKLVGIGRGRMRIESATLDHLAAGYDIVLAEIGAGSPLALPLGRIESSRVVPESALHFDLDVRPWGDVRDLSHVYVIGAPR